MAARMSGQIAVEQRRYAARMADAQGDSLKLDELACTRTENAQKVFKKTFVLIICGCYM